MRSRALSGIELLIGLAIVLGHNVWQVIPNEVFILTALGVVSMRLRNGSVAALGFRRPASWRNLLLLAVAAAALRLVLGEFVLDPFTARFWPPANLPEGADEITGNIQAALIYLAIVWSFAAFGEEISYRGYLLNRGAEALGGSGAAFWIAAAISAVAFGFGHFYKGPPGIIFRSSRDDPRIGLSSRRTQPVGLRPRAWLHRHIRHHSAVLRLGQLSARSGAAGAAPRNSRCASRAVAIQPSPSGTRRG